MRFYNTKKLYNKNRHYFYYRILTMSLQLRKFDMTNIGDDKVVVLIGKRETGKSFLVRDLLYYHQDIPIGTVISGTESANAFYSNIIPSLFIHDSFEPKIVDSVLKRQKLVNKKIQSDKQYYGGSNKDPRAFIILDDCLYDKNWVKDPIIRAMFMNGRHYHLLFIITMQYALGIPPNLRTNVDYVFILRENLINNRKRLYEHYAGMFPNYDMFSQVMDQCTENYECLVIHNNAKSNKLVDQVFWYKASDHPPFHIGSSQYWQHHSTNFNVHYDSDDEDINNYTKKHVINVKKTY